LHNDELVKSDVTNALSPSKQSVKLVGFHKNAGISITKGNSVGADETQECEDMTMDKDSVKIIHHLEAQLAVVPKDRIHELVGG
jgi:hypothetical protein